MAARGRSIERDDRVFRTTLRALLAPRRAIAITVVVVPLLFLQVTYSRDRRALPLAMLMCACFVLVAPTLWRRFFPLGSQGMKAVPTLIYGLAGLVFVVGIGRVLPGALGMAPTFLTTRPSLLVSVALFWVGGWGLARDIDLELHLKHERARAESLEREADHAHLLALRSHLDPHFLFNTLNAIAEWCRSDGIVAERAILQLSSMLRTVTTGIRETSWPLSKELDLTDSLFALYLIRDPELFVYRRQVPPELKDVAVPPMILLPLAENAMKHGPSSGHRGDLSLSIAARGDDIVIELENPGAYRGPREGGSGLPIVEKRLALAYGDRAKFTIRGEGSRTIATLTLPRSLAP